MATGLDFGVACRTALSEMYGDWYRDPWSWPEYSWLQDNFGKFDTERDLLRKKADGGHELRYGAFFHTLEVPKNRLAVRPAVVQDSASRILYTAAVMTHIKKLHGELPDWVFGWRSRAGAPLPEPNRNEWLLYMQHLPAGVEDDAAGLQVDISSFFASVKAEHLSDLTYQRLGKTAAADIVGQVVGQHASLFTRSGLPQRSFASAALAHLYLQAVDDALAVHVDRGRIESVTRWMDDITAFGDEQALYDLYLDVQDKIRHLGLEPNAAKTRLTDARSVLDELRMEGVKEVELPHRVNVERSGFEAVVDVDALEPIQDEILDSPGQYSRTRLRAVLASLRKHKNFSRIDDWLEAAPRIPHAADALSRYFRSWVDDAATSDPGHPGLTVDYNEFLSDWFITFNDSAWARVSWVTAQYALAFPTGRSTVPIVEVLQRWLAKSDDVQQVAIAAQRLAEATPVDCRDIIRSRIDRVADPVILRILALGLLQARAGRGAVKDVLNRDARNLLVLKMLEDRNWSTPRVSRDFDVQDSDELA